MKQNSVLAYQQVNNHNEIETASPHRLIQLYLEKAIERLLQTKTFMQNDMVREKGEALSQVITIVNHLQACLDFEKGREIAVNLNRLYNFITMRLLQANVANNINFVDECLNILRELKAGWDGIENEAN